MRHEPSNDAPNKSMFFHGLSLRFMEKVNNPSLDGETSHSYFQGPNKPHIKKSLGLKCSPRMYFFHWKDCLNRRDMYCIDLILSILK